MPEIKLGGQQHEFLRIMVSSRKYTDAEDYWDGNWLNCEVEVMAGRFRGRVLGTFRAEEFARLRSDVASLVESDEGQASFATMECQLSFELIKDKMGGVRCKGVLMEDPAQEDRLIFSVQLDQSYLPRLLSELDEVVAAFPVRGSPDGAS